MRKITGALVTLLLISGTARADGMGGFGVHGGAVFSNFDYNNSIINQAESEQTDWLAGIHFEGFALSDLFSLRLEGNYIKQGYDLPVSGNVTHAYAQIPVLLKFTPFIGPIGVFAEGGAAVSFNLSNSSGGNPGLAYNDDATKTNWEWIVGAGINLNLGAVLLEVEARYDRGFVNLSNTPGVDIKSKAIEPIAGLTFLF